MLHRLVDCFRGFELVGARQEVNGHRSAGFAVEPAERVVILRTELSSSDIFDPDHRAGGGLANNDVFKFFGVTSRPGALRVSVNSWSAGVGAPPTFPAGACRFCSLIAEMTSEGVRPNFASRSGLIQTRIP